MNKEMWVRPVTQVQQFMPNEYCSACGDSGKVYKFNCNAPRGPLYYYKYGDGTIDGIHNASSSATYLGSYHPCSAKHEAESTDDFYDGFVDYNRNGICEKNERVIVWRGPYNYDGHATANLDMTSWETAKS